MPRSKLTLIPKSEGFESYSIRCRICSNMLLLVAVVIVRLLASKILDDFECLEEDVVQEAAAI